MSTFEQCYEEVLKPNQKYKSSFSVEATRFFENGGYEVLKRLESEFSGCAGICQPPLFYLTKDIAQGIPQFECIAKAMQDTNSKSNRAANITLVMGILILVSSLFSFCICTKYKKE